MTAAVSVVTQLMVVLFSTYTLYLINAAAHTQTAAYRATLHMTRWIGFLEFTTYIPALGTMGLIILAAQLLLHRHRSTKCARANNLRVLHLL